MKFETVQCEVRWYAMFGYSGNELSPVYETFGIFVSEVDAERALAAAGWTRRSSDGWRDCTGYGSAYIKRVVWEIEK